MGEQENFGFGKFVPGFDFLQNLARGASTSTGTTQVQGGMSGLSSWVAPTLNVEELDKRIGELKAVSFWLDQNARALAATIQALELQKMTLATLRGMNFNMGELAQAMKLTPAGAVAPIQPGTATDATGAGAPAGKELGAGTRPGKSRPTAGHREAAAGKAAAGVVDPMQWWGSLTQQFQEIAAGALRETANNPAMSAASDIASGVTAQVMQAATRSATAAGVRARKPGGAGKSATTRIPAKKGARKAGPERR